MGLIKSYLSRIKNDIESYLAVFFMWWEVKFGKYEDNYYKICLLSHTWKYLTSRRFRIRYKLKRGLL